MNLLADAFERAVAAADPRGLGRFLAEAREALDSDPAIRRALPSVVRLLEISDQIEQTHPELADALVTLAQEIEDLDEEERDG